MKSDNIKKEIIKKLTKTQVFILCILSILGMLITVTMLCLFSPEALVSFFNVF